MRKRLTILMMILAVGILSATAQKSEPTTANYRQAVELLDSSDYEGAAALLQEELKLRPKDGYVWNKMSMVYVSQYDLDSAKICMDNAIKYLPKKETEKLGELYSLRAVVNYLTDDIDGALADATSYQKMKPDDEDAYYLKSAIYKQLEKHAESDAELKKLLNVYGVDKSNVYTTLGKNMVERGDYGQALTYLDQAYELNRTSTPILVARSDAHLGLGQLNEAIDDAVLASKVDYDEEGFGQMCYLADDDSRRATVIARVKKELESTDQPVFWNYMLHSIYDKTSNKAESFRYLLRTYKEAPNSSLTLAVAEALKKAEIFDKAYYFVDKAAKMEDTDPDDLTTLRFQRAQLLNAMGKTQEAVDSLEALRNDIDAKNVIDQSIANIYFYAQQPKKSIARINTIEDESFKDAEYWNMAARYYMMDGNADAALLCLSQAIGSGETGNEVLFAHALTGDRDKTLQFMRKMAEEEAGEDEEDEGSEKPALTDDEVESAITNNIGAYNMACVYSLIGDKAKGISYLTKALKDDWNDFRLLDFDTDLDNIRNESEFISVVKMYKSLAQKEREELLDIYQEELPE